ncbi:ATP-dependent zinc protease family protein [Parapedobacter sp. 10938]|uniref:ATP-dependent zinc protease family protein n=1 Tax=Parapedobacter flavus TaxID=3110225 RepID=UPI002DBBD30E|nr:RimK/LysX family protein [Parapedobacter sp. 10938]MEC3878744.1 RimK/LysX family protein [Parapedobacter sp. 10938]
MANKLKTIGWKEVVDLPDLDIYGVPAKVDTGARTSVLHCSHIQLIKKGRKQFVEFRPLDDFRQPPTVTYTLPFHSERRIKNSFGQEENRYVINTTVSLFGEPHPIEISLRDRSGMEFPMLLGRSFLRKKFIVDVSRTNLATKSTNHK